MKYKFYSIFVFIKQLFIKLVNSSKMVYNKEEWRNIMEENTYPESLELLKPYLDETLYETCVSNKAWEEYAATCLFSEIDDIYPITKRITPEWLESVDISLKEKGQDLKKILSKELQSVVNQYNEYQEEKKKPEYQDKKKRYASEWDRWKNEQL